jgi:hypothetical protein
MIAIYSAFYNVERMGFSWRESLANWLDFQHGQGQICIAVNTSDDNSGPIVREWVAKWQTEHPDSATRVDIIDTAIPYSDPTFDGQIKAAALAACTEPFATLLDCDELLYPQQRRHWLALTREMERDMRVDALLIPVVDLFQDEQHYRSIGSKFYLHRNRPDITRGVVRQARRPDGSIDTSISDTTEAIYRETGELLRATSIVMPLPHYLLIGHLESGEIPMVLHTGWLSHEQRLRQSAFWKDVWTARRGGRDPEPETTLATLEAIPRYRHNLPNWRDAR